MGKKDDLKPDKQNLREIAAGLFLVADMVNRLGEDDEDDSD